MSGSVKDSKMFLLAGLTSETLLEQVRQNAKPWKLRDRRLLVAPMRLPVLCHLVLSSSTVFCASALQQLLDR